MSMQDCYWSPPTKCKVTGTLGVSPYKMLIRPGVVFGHDWLPGGLRTHTTGRIEWTPSNLGPISPKHVLHIEQGSQIDFSGGSQVLNGKHMPKCFAGRGLQITEEPFNQSFYMTFYHTSAICLEQSQFTLSTGVLLF